MAAPVTLLMAGVFEYFAKERLAETDLKKPLPQLVETAAKEEEARNRTLSRLYRARRYSL